MLLRVLKESISSSVLPRAARPPPPQAINQTAAAATATVRSRQYHEQHHKRQARRHRTQVSLLTTSRLNLATDCITTRTATDKLKHSRSLELPQVALQRPPLANQIKANQQQRQQWPNQLQQLRRSAHRIVQLSSSLASIFIHHHLITSHSSAPEQVINSSPFCVSFVSRGTDHSTANLTAKPNRTSDKQTTKVCLTKAAATATSVKDRIMFNSKKRMAPIGDQLLLMPAHKLSKMIKDGSLSSVKLCELYIERIKQVQPHINAMAQDRFKEALEEAKQIDSMLADFRSGKKSSAGQEVDQSATEALLSSPLLGIPISVKESIQVKGMRNSCGLWLRRNVSAAEDAVVVKNVRRYGMIPICTTNIPECTLYWADCQNKVYGRSRNPYDLSRITGASSGGEGSLIGSGGSLIGIGSDIGGSLRIPAHYCGIYSHKPSPFLVSSVGNFPECKEARMRMFTLGPMTRYASDLRPLFKCLLLDQDNATQDTYYRHQPENIASIRRDIIQKLEQQTSVDLSQVRLFYFNYNEASELRGKQSIRVQQEILDGQQELIDHFSSKFGCHTEQINMDKYLKKALITWQCMLTCAGSIDRETSFEENELKRTFGIDSILMEMVKMPLGLSNHTKESLMILAMGSAMPHERSKAYEMCEKFEKIAAELKQDLESTLGELGVLVMPTMPTVAYKNNVALLKTSDLRFSALSNILQLPVSHATIRLDRKHKMPFGVSLAAKQFNDLLTLAVAEEVELAFGGWTPPSGLTDSIKAGQEHHAGTTTTATSDPINEKHQQQHKVAKEELAVQ